MSTSSALQLDLDFALQLADIADAISLARFTSHDLQVSTKPDKTFVTDADTAVEAAIRAHIEQHRPDDGFFGEESGAFEQGSRQWVIDPIDGTSNYLRGVPNWATLISLTVDGKPIVGVVSAPAFRERWWGATGLGAWGQRYGEDARRLQVSRIDELTDASLSFQSIAQWRDAGRLRDLLQLSDQVWRDRAYGDSWAYMLLAEGKLDIVAEFDVKSFDIAAHVPIIEEAGGKFTDIDGTESVWNTHSLATNGLLHKQVLETLTLHHGQRD